MRVFEDGARPPRTRSVVASCWARNKLTAGGEPIVTRRWAAITSTQVDVH
jgi:hypothetical protein